MGDFQSDPVKTSERSKSLEGYFSSKVLHGSQFLCATQQECKDSHAGSFYAGQLPHIGRHYDLKRNNNPFRVIVVGQEYGHKPEHVDLAARHKMVMGSGTSLRFKASAGFRQRNPHMKGCTNLLRLLFDLELGSDYEREFLSLNGGRVHIFDCFALVNFLLCSAVSGYESNYSEGIPLRGKRGCSTSTMRRNCTRHFRATLEILEPTIIVAQGHGVRKWMNAAFGPFSEEALQPISVGGRSVTFLAFTHPSAHGKLNWGNNERTPYLLNEVAPTVRRMLAMLFSRKYGDVWDIAYAGQAECPRCDEAEVEIGCGLEVRP